MIRLKNTCSEFKLKEMNNLEKIKTKSFDLFKKIYSDKNITQTILKKI